MAGSLDHGAVNSFLRGLRYPISREDLVREAKANDVSDALVDALEGMPAGSYDSQARVMRELEREGQHIS